MRTIQLVNGIHSSVLGFGCAPILGAVDGVTAKRALDFALEHGINHLDLARSYGYGEAEQFVGKLLKGKREKVVLARKFGIVANWKARALTPFKPFIRMVRKRKKENPASVMLPAEQTVSMGDRFHDRIPLRGSEMRKSLEKSLSALRTEYLDYFFVHEPTDRITYIDELTHTAENLKKEGKIRAWGLAYMRDKETLHQDYLNRFDVLQFNNTPGVQGYRETVNNRGAFSNVMFSPFRGGSTELTPPQKLKRLLEDFPRSVILCSMYNTKHILDNIKAV